MAKVHPSFSTGLSKNSKQMFYSATDTVCRPGQGMPRREPGEDTDRPRPQSRLSMQNKSISTSTLMNLISAGSLTSFSSFITGNWRNNWIKTFDPELQENSAPGCAESSACLPFSVLPSPRASASVTQQRACFFFWIPTAQCSTPGH